MLAEGYSDRAPSDEFEALQLAAQEQRVWLELLQASCWQRTQNLMRSDVAVQSAMLQLQGIVV